MKILKLFLLIIFSVASFNIFASPYDLILVGDPVIEDLRFLSLETGHSILSFTPPFAPQEIQNFLNRVNPSGLSAPAKEAYNRIIKRLTPSAPLSLSWEIFSLSLNINSTVEGRTRFDADFDWYPASPKIPSLLSLPLKLYFADAVQIYFDPAVSIDPYDYSPNGNISNNIVFLGENDIHGNSPFRTFIAAGGPWWSFQLGRDRLSFGTGISGNLSVADNPPYYEFMRFSLFSNQFKYALIVIQSPLTINKQLYPDLNEKADYLKMTSQRYLYLSRLDFSLFNVLSISLTEGVMVGNSALELRFFNPLMIFHNAMTWRDYDLWPETKSHKGFMVGSFFSAEINWNIMKSLSAYGQFMMTELSIGPELTAGRKEPPNGLGFLGGLQYSHSFENWGSLFYLECIYTYPFLYILTSPFASIIYMQSVEFVHENKYYHYFGYPRDTFALTAGARFFDFDTLVINGEFSLVMRGEHGGYPIVWDFEKDYSLAPSGIAENNFILSFGVQWKVFSFLSLNGNITGIYSQNYKNISNIDKFGGQLSLSASFHY